MFLSWPYIGLFIAICTSDILLTEHRLIRFHEVMSIDECRVSVRLLSKKLISARLRPDMNSNDSSVTKCLALLVWMWRRRSLELIFKESVLASVKRQSCITIVDKRFHWALNLTLVTKRNVTRTVPQWASSRIWSEPGFVKHILVCGASMCPASQMHVSGKVSYSLFF